MEQQPLVFNLPDGQEQFTIRQGQAPKNLDEQAPVKIDIAGTINAPLCWLEKRIADIDQHKAYLHVNRDQLTMLLVINEDDPYRRGSIVGKLQFSKVFLSFGINSESDWEPAQLGQFLKMNRTYFVSRDQNNVVVDALRSFKAKVNSDVEREVKQNGNRAMVFRQAVDSNIPESFKLCIPIFSGCAPVEIEVETYAEIDGSDVTITLMSAGAMDAIEDVKLHQFNDIIEKIRIIAPELVIIEQ